jgi:nickel-dependent lactate racemase
MCSLAEIELPWGERTVTFSLARRNLAGIYRPQSMPASADTAGAIAQALTSPLCTEPLSKIARPGQRVVILVDDHTRGTPAAEILPVVLDELASAGVADENITVLIAHGTHRQSTPEEVRRKVGPAVGERFRVVQHDCTDAAGQVYLGLTSRGTPVWVNRLAVEADRRVGIGHIGPSPYAGYSGGGKLILPGVASLDSINANHTLVALGVGRPGRVDVPCRQDIDEAAALLGLDMVVDVVLDHQERVVAAFAGAPDPVFATGVALARRIYEVPCPGPVDIAVTSGFPYDLDLYQAERAVEYADALVRRGGSIILAATCPDGIGSREFYELAAAPGKEPDDFLRDVVRRNGRVTYSILGYILARIRAEKRVYVVTEGIPADKLRDMGFLPLDSVQLGVDALLAEHGPGAQVAVLPMGASTIPSLGGLQSPGGGPSPPVHAGAT